MAIGGQPLRAADVQKMEADSGPIYAGFRGKAHTRPFSGTFELPSSSRPFMSVVSDL